jgi:hypothetical protein
MAQLLKLICRAEKASSREEARAILAEAQALVALFKN